MIDLGQGDFAKGFRVDGREDFLGKFNGIGLDVGLVEVESNRRRIVFGAQGFEDGDCFVGFVGSDQDVSFGVEERWVGSDQGDCTVDALHGFLGSVGSIGKEHGKVV